MVPCLAFCLIPVNNITGIQKVLGIDQDCWLVECNKDVRRIMGGEKILPFISGMEPSHESTEIQLGLS